MREPRGIGDEDHAAEPHRVEHSVGAVACVRARRRSRPRRRARARRTASRAPSTWVRPRHPISASTPSVAPTMMASPSGYAKSTTSTTDELFERLRRGFQEQRDPRRDHDEHHDQPVDPAVQLEARDAVPHQSTNAATISGYQASQRTSEIVAVASGSPRKAQMMSPSTHSARPAPPASTRPGCARTQRADERAEHRGEPFGRAAHAFVEPGVDAIAAEADETVHREPDDDRHEHDEEDAHEPGHAVVPHRERRGALPSGGWRARQPQHPNDRPRRVTAMDPAAGNHRLHRRQPAHHAYADIATRRAWTELDDIFVPDIPVTVDLREPRPLRVRRSRRVP